MPVKKIKITKIDSSYLVDMKGYKDQKVADFDGKNLARFIETNKRDTNYIQDASNHFLSLGIVSAKDMDNEDRDYLKNNQMKEFISHVALLKMAKETYAKRTFWDKFFHPFRTYAENKAIKSLDDEIRSKFDADESIYNSCDVLLDEAYTDDVYNKTINNEYGLISNRALDEIRLQKQAEEAKEKEDIEKAIKEANEQYAKDSKILSEINTLAHGNDGINYEALGNDVNGTNKTEISKVVNKNEIKNPEIDVPKING